MPSAKWSAAAGRSAGGDRSEGRPDARRPGGQRYPAEWPERIRALAAGELTPVTPRSAATVLLLRDESPGVLRDEDADPVPPDEECPGHGPGTEGPGPAVHMLRRRASMAFAGGAYAYPGGAVDPRDERDIGWAGPSRARWAERLGTDEATAQALVCAAVRETFEEAGVLLAGPDRRTVVADTTGADWERDRAALVAHELAFADFLAQRGLVLRSDLLGGWARWITPEFERRRYDTWFFVAALPTGQRARNASTEADRTVWIRPADAAARYDRGELLMLPPTIATLREIAGYGSAAEVLRASADRDLAPVLARARLEGGEVVLSWPGHDEFTTRVSTEADAEPEAEPDGGPSAEDSRGDRGSHGDSRDGGDEKSESENGSGTA